ncbi:hypothetical protein [Rhabdochlamydiaceae symbiont of Dictyostelium giganteum]|uniref:hypothetical protein n=1 Tax=Rhabdochlamydiaceae symbiont of Dictyostelium giganteum TaxID=3342349 RepID=UPI0038508C4C
MSSNTDYSSMRTLIPSPTYTVDKIGFGVGLTLGVSGIAYKLMSNQESQVGTLGIISTVALSTFGLIRVKQHLDHKVFSGDVKPTLSEPQENINTLTTNCENTEEALNNENSILSEKEETLDSLKLSYNALIEEHNKFKAAYKALDQERSNLETKVYSLEDELDELRDNFDKLEDDFNNAQRVVDEKNDAIELLEIQLQYRQQVADSSQSHIDHMLQLMDELEDTLDTNKKAKYIQQIKSTVANLKSQTPSGSSGSSNASTPSKSSRTILHRTPTKNWTPTKTPRKDRSNNLHIQFQNVND